MTLQSYELPESAGPTEHFVLLSQSAKQISSKGKVLAQSEAGVRLGVPRASGRTDATEGVVLWRTLLWPDFLEACQSTSHS